ncbi:AAA family ATPase [Mycobacterium sp. M1]|uniref:AAA family ATPase n=1 Tax=Mycolicibacter acidiphilus TaxID=2835306 RepID=A0ABS5RL71_9MYCO|nr:AAA family ATPase [Mycolicibacter acidiphilus]MBS9534339.1 AAA family ATPase [Mycolicibacter acidiphilus]
MSEAEVGTFAREAAIPVETIGRRIIDSGLGKDDSLLIPGQPIWTMANLDELVREYVDRPDAGPGGFFEKLKLQLADSSPAAVQLFAELLILNTLPIINLGGTLKVKQVNNVLGMSSVPVALPDDVETALLAGGVFNGGQAFTTYRWAQIVYLIQVARHFKSLPEQRQVDALADPLIFRDEVNAVPTGQAAQRHSLLYLAFPHFYLPVVSNDHRKLLRDSFAAKYLADPSGDLDTDIAQIYEAITDKEGGHVDLYEDPWIERWLKKPAPPVRRAWRIQGSNVKGQDMVPIWRRKGTVSLAASLLRPVDADVDRDDLKGFVDEDYASSDYTQRQEKLDEFFAFLARMHPQDLVVTVSQGRVYFATITGDAEYTKSTDGRSNLRRTVKWYDTWLPLSELPDEVSARLSTQGEVLDLSQQLDTLLALAEHRRPPVGAAALHLPDATKDLADRLHVPLAWLQECIELLRDRPQLIFYGPPGTGKTYIAQVLAQHLATGANVKIVQFHPAYSYEDFFEGYRPAGQSGGQVGFALKAGPLRSLVGRANDNSDAVYVLIIDEINRGNLAKIFGELYFLLEYRDTPIDLMYHPDATEPFTLPKNIVILGTMNTADRSIALVDAAMRRRFAFVALHPSEEPTRGLLRRWLAATGRPAETANLLDELNARIDDPDFKIGPSYFMRRAVYDADGRGLERVWRTAILPLLEEHHYGDRNVDVPGKYGLPAIEKAVHARADVAYPPAVPTMEHDDSTVAADPH